MTQMQDRIDVGAVIESQKSSWFQRRLIFWIAVTMMIEGNDNQVAGYSAPALIEFLHIDRSSFGTLFGVGLFGYLLGALAFGSAGDRFGRRRVIISGAFAFGLFTLATAYATTFTAILVLRFLAGAGLGAAVPSSVALMAEYAPKSSRSTRISLMFVAYTLGAALGGFIASWLLPRFGWTSVFMVGGWAGLILAGILCVTLPESLRFLVVRHARREELARILGRLDPTKLIGPQTTFVSEDVSQPGVPVVHLFAQGRASKTILLWIAFISTQMTQSFMTNWLPTVTHQGGLTLQQAEITTALLQIGGAVGSFAFGRLLDRRGLVSLAIGYFVAAPVVAAIGISGGSALFLMPLATLAGFCVPGGQAGINALSGTLYPTYMRSTGSGWAFGIGRIGSILGPVIGGILLSLNLSLPRLFLFVAAPALVVAVALLLLRHVAGNRPELEGDRVRSSGGR